MNIVEVLEVALPPLPPQRVSDRLPCAEPNLLAHEDVEGGELTVLVMKPAADGFYRLTPLQWQILKLFDGKRSFSQVASECQNLVGTRCSEEEARELADYLSSTDLLYKPASEKITALAENLRRDRRHGRKSRFGDLSEITIFSFDPDPWLTAIYPYLRFIYTGWFTLVTFALFAWMAFVLLGHWREILGDTATYYTFSQKGLGDLAEFWVLLMLIAAIHETAHGLTCKHYGGGVHRMGFLLMYSLPCFFCDTTEAWVYTGRFGRILTMLAGIWIELTICAFATMAWWATSPGAWLHDMAYKVILFTGIAVVVMNINPLVKLDGYFISCELLRIGDLKEKSTAYTSSWVRNRIFRLPVELEYVPPRRRPLFISYALASGAYSYLLLVAVTGFCYNVLYKFSPEWAFLPALGIVFLLFKSRLVILEKFMRTVYLDKKERLRALLRKPQVVAVAVVAALVFFVPLWPTFVQGRFELQARKRAVVRTEVGGSVARVLVSEGQQVASGAPLLQLRNLALESEAAQTRSALSLAESRVQQAQFSYTGFGPAEQQRRQLQERDRLLSQQLSQLQMLSPTAGVVTTPRPADLAGAYLVPGATVLEIADLSTMEARVYLPEYEVRDLRPGARVDLHLDSWLGTLPGTLTAIASAPSQIAPGLVPKQQAYEGLRPPPNYVAWITLENTRNLRENMAGTAKILVRHESLAQGCWHTLRDGVERKLW
ncbi:MAG TPA: efflux RND transporter periplasmic adaptor subunit [Terriglobales bacterium]|nr:efflux RND transporter periplasmic adaptor subunit [Terriglobales bacterium]